MPRLSAFLSELRRRRVFRVTAVYACVAFVIFQIVDATFEPLHLPDWLSTAVVVLLALGFPIAVGMAWAFDITEQGVVRTAAKGPAEAKARPRVLVSNRILAIIAALAVAVAVWSWWGRPAASVPDKSIAVLPFVNFSDSKEDEYFSDGITEDIMAHLAKISELTVIGRTSVMQYKGTAKRLRDIGEELGVATLLEGSIRRAGGKVRIVSQLIDARTEKHLWAETYDREVDEAEIFALQSDVARRIAEALKATLTPDEKERIGKKPTENLTAYEDYLNGRFYWAKRTREDTWKAVEYYEATIAKDPNYALAYSGIADCYVVDAGGLLGVTIDESRLKARTFALRALELDSTLSEPHSVLAQILWHLDWDFSGADKEFIQALRLNPNDVTSLRRYAWGLVPMDRGEEAIQRIRQAYRLDPISLITNMDMGALLYSTRRYDEAIEQCLKTIGMDPENSYARSWLALSYQQKGMTAEAVAEWEKAGELFQAQVARGNLEKARKMLEDQIESEEPQRNALFWIAWRFAALGDIDKTFEWLERSYDERSPWLSYLKVYPDFDTVRDDPRYTALLEKMGLE